MSETIVRHPETGKPALEVKSYVELDRKQLEDAIVENQADLDQLVADKTATFEASLGEDPEVKAARSAVEDSKSQLTSFDELEPQQPAEPEAVGDGGEVEGDDEAGDEADGSDGSDDDSEDDSESVPVPVSVTPAAPADADSSDDTESDEDY